MGATRFTDWSAGKHDDYLRTIGQQAAAYPFPIYVRPWPEMNGDWQSFQPTASGEKVHGGTPAQFIAAWRYVVDKVRANGGSNIKWVFNPYAATYAGTTDVRTIWPGSPYVDVLGIDGYNWGGGPAPWQSFDTIFKPMYDIVTSLDATMPVWICEFGSREPTKNDGVAIDSSHSKADWIRDAMTTTAFPRIQALVWFNEQKERDWRVDSSAASLTEMRTQLAAIGRGMPVQSPPTLNQTPTASPLPTAPVKVCKGKKQCKRVRTCQNSVRKKSRSVAKKCRAWKRQGMLA